jgi:hypothetical protein
MDGWSDPAERSRFWVCRLEEIGYLPETKKFAPSIVVRLTAMKHTNPRTVDAVGKNRGEMVLAMQSEGQIGHSWGNNLWSRAGTPEL